VAYALVLGGERVCFRLGRNWQRKLNGQYRKDNGLQ